MRDEELEQDELEMQDGEDGEELSATSTSDEPAEDSGESEDSSETSASRPARKAKASEAEEPLPGIEAKQRERDELARAMEEFLARGGLVQEIEANVVADPPKKPDNKYGSRPI